MTGWRSNEMFEGSDNHPADPEQAGWDKFWAGGPVVAEKPKNIAGVFFHEPPGCGHWHFRGDDCPQINNQRG